MSEPFLWAAIDDDGSLIGWGHSRVSACCGIGEAECIPLYRSPTLTDEEREAVQAAADIMDARNRLGGPKMFRGSDRAATLRGLLERLKSRGADSATGTDGTSS